MRSSHQRSSYVTAAALLLCISPCHAQQYPWSQDYGLNALNTLSNSLSIGEGERRHRLTEHRKLKKVVSAIDDVQQSERGLNRKDDAWAELSKKEKKEVVNDKQRGGSKKDEPDRKDKEDDNGKSTSKKEGKSKDDDSKKDSKDKKNDKDKKDGRDKYYESLTKKEKKEYNKNGRKGDRHDDDEYEICICEDGERYHRFLDVDTEWSDVDEDTEWSDVDEEEPSDAEWSYDESWVDSFELEQQQHSMGRSLFNLFGGIGSNPTEESVAAGNMTTFAAKRSPNKGSDQKKSKDWGHDGHDDGEKVYKERGSKGSKSGRIKKSKMKGGKSLKEPPKGSGKSSKSKGPSGSDKQSSKSNKLKSSKSSKPCKCRPLTRRPTQKPHKTKRPMQKPHKTKRPTRRPSIVTKKPVPNIAPKPTTEKPVRTMRPTDKPVRTSRPSFKPFGKPTRRPTIKTDKPVRTSRPSFKPFGRPTRRPSILTDKPVRTSRPSERPAIIDRPSNKPTSKPSQRPNPITLKPVRTPRPTEGDPSRKPSRRPTVQPTPKPTVPSTLTWYYWGAEEGLGGPPGQDQTVPEPGFGDDVFCPAAGPRYTLLVDGNGVAYVSGFIESKPEYRGHFGVDPDELSAGSNGWKRIDRVNIDGRERNSPAFSQVYTGATGSADSGEMHSLLIDQNGNVYTTGDNSKGQLCLGDTEARFIPHKVTFDEDVDSPAIAAALGEDFTLILLANGKVYGCGSNGKGELGLGSNVKSVETPNSDNGLSNIVELSSGLNFALFMSSTGKIYATGSNIYMQQCKDTSGNPETSPKEITALSKKIKAIEAGRESSYFLFFDGTVASCGRNDEGQLGDGTFIDRDKTAVIIPNDYKIVGLGSGPSSQSAFFIGENAVYGTGANDRNQLGIGQAGKVALPTAVEFDSSGLDIVGVSSSGTHTVACNLNVLTDAPTMSPSLSPKSAPTPEPTPAITCKWLYWGANEGRGGEIGTNQETPLFVDEEANDVSTGPRYTLLVDANGDAYAAGFIESKFEYRGQFGVDPNKLSEGSNKKKLIDQVNVDGKTKAPPSFSKVYTGATGSANSGEMHSLLIDEDGDVYTTGNNNRGQLCLGDTEARFVPHKVSLPRPALAAALGEDFTLILLDNGKVYGCGSNEKGELGLGSNVKLAETPNSNNGLSDIKMLYSGLNYALFLSRAGKAYATGSNIYMQQCENSDGDPTTTPKMISKLRNEDVQSIMAGRESSYFLLKDGVVKSCGRNDEGQLGDGTFVDNEYVTVDIPGGNVITSIGSGSSAQSAFFFGETAVFGAGANDRFQLGIGEIGSRKFPVKIEFKDLPSVSGMEKISASGTQTVALDCPKTTRRPTLKPTSKPTSSPTRKPTNKPTNGSAAPTKAPATAKPVTPGTSTPTKAPATASPSRFPSKKPTNSPIKQGSPTRNPVTQSPSRSPSRRPSVSPSKKPTNSPIQQGSPTRNPVTQSPSRSPSRRPSVSPSKKPTNSPIKQGLPTRSPVTQSPSRPPSARPSMSPSTLSPTIKAGGPSSRPTPAPSSSRPTQLPTKSPVLISSEPTRKPTPGPSVSPTSSPSVCNEVPELKNTIRFEARDPRETAELGYSVSVYNKTVIAGSIRATSSASIYAGAAYIFNFNYETQEWEYVQKITTPASTTGDQVGFSTSIRGKFVVLGSPFNKQFGNNTGYIYIYERGGDDGDTFTQLASVFGPDFTPNSNFGWSVSTNRYGTIAVGAPGERGNIGTVFIFKTKAFGQWQLVGKLEPDNIAASPSTYGNFGWSVAINDANTVYVGAPFDVSGGSKTGSVSIYTEVSNDSWSLLDRITPSDGNAGDQFGVSLDIDDSSTFIIGSNRARVSSQTGAGAAYVYDISGGKVNFVQKLVSEKPSASENYGESVSIEAGRIAVGAPNPGGIGTVYLYYNRTATKWDFSESVGPVNKEDGIDGQGILYGRAVGVSKNALAVGAPLNDLGASDSGSVYIYDVIVNKCNPATPSPTKSPSNALQSSNKVGGSDEPL